MASWMYRRWHGPALPGWYKIARTMSRLLAACLAAATMAAAILATAAAGQQTTGGNRDPAKERANVERIYARIQAHERESARKRGAARITIPNTTVSYEIVPVPAGEFEMGSAAGDAKRKKDEQPRHKVQVE